MNGETGIGASGFERSYATKHYTKRTGLTVQNLKATLLVATVNHAVLDIHVSTTRKHDTQIAPQVIDRSADRIDVFAGDKGYDNQSPGALARDRQIRPLLEHRELSGLYEAWNERLDDDIYHQRTLNETVNAVIKKNSTRSSIRGSGSARSEKSSSNASFTTSDEGSLWWVIWSENTTSTWERFQHSHSIFDKFYVHPLLESFSAEFGRFSSNPISE